MDASQPYIELEKPPIFHCVSRCVYRSFLGDEEYQQRWQWFEPILHRLSDVFCINVIAYTVMANHYHVVLHVDTSGHSLRSELDIVTRWHRLFEGSVLSHRWLAGEPLYLAEYDALYASIDLWRKRLVDVSWFMRVVNDAISEQAEGKGGAGLVNAPVTMSSSFWQSPEVH